MYGRDANVDSSRDGSQQKKLSDEGATYDTDNSIKTLMDEKRAYKGRGPTAGTRGAADIPVAEGA